MTRVWSWETPALEPVVIEGVVYQDCADSDDMYVTWADVGAEKDKRSYYRPRRVNDVLESLVGRRVKVTVEVVDGE